MPVISSDEMIKIVRADGWYPISQRGSHQQFKHPMKTGRVTIPVNGKDLDRKTEKSILRQAGL